MGSSGIRPRQLALALIACLSMVLLSSQAALCFGRPGHLVLELQGNGGCGATAEGHAGGACFCQEDEACHGCVQVDLLQATVKPLLGGGSLVAPPPCLHLPPQASPRLSRSGPPLFEPPPSPPFPLASLRSTILLI